MMTSFLDYRPVELSSTSGYVLERLAAHKVFVSAASSTTLGEFCKFLALNAQEDSSDVLFKITYLQLITLTQRCDGDMDKSSVLYGFDGYLTNVRSKNHAYVFVNAGSSSFANVFFVATGVVALFQIDDQQPASTLDPVSEVKKCGLLDESTKPSEVLPPGLTRLLCKTANVETDHVLFALVRSSAECPKSMREKPPTSCWYTLCRPSEADPRGRDFMYPLLWPTCIAPTDVVDPTHAVLEQLTGAIENA